MVSDQRTSMVLLRGPRHASWPSPYLDIYGEEVGTVLFCGPIRRHRCYSEGALKVYSNEVCTVFVGLCTVPPVDSYDILKVGE